MSKMHIKTGDNVVIISGKDKGKKGRVIETFPKGNKVLVEKLNMVSRHTKPRNQRDDGGILKKEAPLYASKVMHVCGKCGEPTRIGRKVLGDGTKSRYCKHCGEVLDD